MEHHATKKLMPEKCKECSPWCLYETECESVESGELKYKIVIDGNYLTLHGPINNIMQLQEQTS